MTGRRRLIVLGLGGHGQCRRLLGGKAARRLLGLEQFQIGHLNGGSEDHSDP